MNSIIAVTTAAGDVGSRVAQFLIHAGVSPRLLVHDASRLPEAVGAVSDVWVGDQGDARYVTESLSGVEALLAVVPTNLVCEDPVADALKLGRILVEAVQRHQVRRVVFLSSGGAEHKDSNLIGVLGDIEDLFNATGVDTVHLRPGYMYSNLLMNVEELKGGTLSTNIPLNLPTAWNDPRDVGEVAAARLLSQHWSGQRVLDLSGPQDLSFGEVAGIISESTGNQVKAIQAPEEESKKAMLDAGMNAAAVEALLAMSREVASGRYGSRKGDAEFTLHTTLASWCQSKLKAALAG